MFDYFKTMHSVANADERSYSSIKDLTIDIAKSGGYRRDYYTYKNGKTVVRTMYNTNPSTWDSALVAKWYCYYEKAFYSKLLKHPEFSEYYTFILDRTFSILFNSLQIDKISSDAALNVLFNMSLGNRIGEVLGMIGSNKRLEDSQHGIKKRITMKFALNHMAASLDNLEDDHAYTLSYNDYNINPSILDLKTILHDNKYGKCVLESLLYSDKKVDINKIDKFINIEEKTPDALNLIKDAYIKITEYVYNDLDKSSKLHENLKSKYTRITKCKNLCMNFDEELSI